MDNLQLMIECYFESFRRILKLKISWDCEVSCILLLKWPYPLFVPKLQKVNFWSHLTSQQYAYWINEPFTPGSDTGRETERVKTCSWWFKAILSFRWILKLKLLQDCEASCILLLTWPCPLFVPIWQKGHFYPFWLTNNMLLELMSLLPLILAKVGN